MTYISHSVMKLAAGEEEGVSIWGGGSQPRCRIYFISQLDRRPTDPFIIHT